MSQSKLSRGIAYALGRTEAYIIVVIVFLAVVVAIVGGWPGWIIPASIVTGAVLLVLLVWDSLSDPNTERQSSIADINPGQVRDQKARAKVRKALEYVRGIQRMVANDQEGLLGIAKEELPQLEQAARLIYQMCLRLQEFYADPIIRQDLARLEELQARRKSLPPGQAAHLEALVQLHNLVQSAEQQVDSVLAHLGRSYAEMQSIKVTPEFRGRAQAALEQLRDSAQRLSDLADGYDEAYSSRSPA